MTADVVNLGCPAHQRSQELLPWFAMGTLDVEERDFVDAHVSVCAACQRDLQWQQELRRAHAVSASPAVGYDVERALGALRARERASAVTHPLRTPRWRRFATSPHRSLALRVAAGLVLVCAAYLGATRLLFLPAAEYRALNQSPVPTARLVAVFAPQTSEAQLRTMLLANGARIVDGPTAADAYTLAVAADRADSVVQRLRAEPSVLLIQPLDTKAAH